MEDAGFSNISNSFHDQRNYVSGSPGSSKFMMEIVENFGFANIVHGYCKYFKTVLPRLATEHIFCMHAIYIYIYIYIYMCVCFASLIKPSSLSNTN